MPMTPRSASLVSSARGNACASSHSLTWGRISLSQNSRIERRSRCCSSVRQKFTPKNLPRPFGHEGHEGNEGHEGSTSVPHDYLEVPRVVLQEVVVHTEIQAPA